MKTNPVSKEEKRAIRDAKRFIGELATLDANEAETRRRIERLFSRLMGYDVFKHLSREHAVHGAGETEHVDFAIQLHKGSDVKPEMVVELKRVGIDLGKKHLKQVTSYAIDMGCEWILLTNSREWRIYHVQFSQPPETKLIERWNLLEDDVTDLARKFDIISYKSIRKDGLKKLWLKAKTLAIPNLLRAITSQESLKLLCRLLRKEGGVAISARDIIDELQKLLNESALIAIEKVQITLPEHKRRKRTAKKEKNEKQKISGTLEKETKQVSNLEETDENPNSAFLSQ